MNEQLPTHDGSRPRILVGVDGSPDSIAALKVAVWAAAARGGTVMALNAWAAPLGYASNPLVLPELRREAEKVLQDALHDALGARPLVEVHSIVTPETPAAALVVASEGAELLVVGSRGHGGFGGLLIGSISMACTMHAHCPVLVVHTGAALSEAGEARSGARVVVGVGHGLASVQLLRTAALAADELDAELLAITAWGYPGKERDGRPDLRAGTRANAERRLEQEVAAAFLDGGPSKLRTEVREGTPAAVLVDASRTADLVVVGRMGHSQWAGVMRGSVSLPVAEHAECPVLVIPGVRDPAWEAAHRREVATADR
jgi:nucleotide-binding universal stress UspA family protein